MVCLYHFIKLFVVPLVYVSIVCGIVELKDIRSFGRLGGKNLGLYIIKCSSSRFQLL